MYLTMKRLTAFFLSICFLSICACGGGGTYYVPTSSPIVPFEKPERADLLGEEEEVEEEVVEDVVEEEPEAPAAAPAEAPASL